jgi:hypothetical protein
VAGCRNLVILLCFIMLTSRICSSLLQKAERSRRSHVTHPRIHIAIIERDRCSQNHITWLGLIARS